MMKKIIYVALGLVVLASCEQVTPTLFRKVPAGTSKLEFTNQVIEKDSLNLANNYYFYNGAGVTVCDFNNDGFQDIFMGGNHVPSRLFLNSGNLEFRDITEDAGLLNPSWVSGSTFVDINADGLQDLFVCTVGKDEPNLLYVNQGFDKDGVPIFKEEAESYGLHRPVIATQAVFFDFDKDDDLDLFLAVNSQLMNNRNETIERNLKSNNFTRDRFYINNGDDTFSEVSEKVGIVNEGYSLGVAVNDFNNDGWPDVYVSNDFISNDLIYINNKNGGFEEKGRDYLRHASMNGMGVDLADINNDGLVDITVVDMLPRSNRRRKLMFTPLNYDLFEYRSDLGYIDQHIRNTLQINNGPDAHGNLSFSEIGCLSGIYSTDWSWAPLWADFDNSGSLDLYITNGYKKDLTDLDFSLGIQENLKFGTKEHKVAYQLEQLSNLRPIKSHNFLYLNRGTLELEDHTKKSGLDEPSFSHGAAFADLDNDGDLDLVVNNLSQEAFLYENRSVNPESNNHTFLKVELQGRGKNNNSLGAKLKLYIGETVQTYYHSNVRGYLSSMGQTIHFGMGTTKKADSLKVVWPDGTFHTVTEVAANQTLKVVQKDAVNGHFKNPSVQPKLFHNAADSLLLQFKHSENSYTDFKDNPLMLKMYSKEGPAMAVGDVDNDGKDDLIIGGAAGVAASLFIQKDGRFERHSILDEDAIYEDMGMLLFDIDGDTDLDLYVVSGGVEYKSNSPLYEDRLYINNNSNFVRSSDLQGKPISGGTVRGADYDRDGDLDLFVGGKIYPGNYPQSPQSMLLENEKGALKDKTPDAMRKLGMVSDAIWTDFNGDGWLDLIVVGEWTQVQFFINNKGVLSRFDKTGLPDTSGWWNSITSGDFDNDGDMDYVLGNFGKNSYLTASQEMPIRLYAGDYDENGKLDPIISYYSEDDQGILKEFPVHTRDALIDQIVGYKRRFKDYLSFATADFSEVLREHDKEGTTVMEAKILTSSYLENKGGGVFEISPLPLECQLAPIYGMMAEDVDFDGNLDILLTGNLHSAEPLFGNLDALNGVYLKGNGDGGFETLHSAQSGLHLNGDRKSIVKLHVDDTPVFVSAANNGHLKAHIPVGVQGSKTIVRLKPSDVYAKIILSNGISLKREFNYGSTYLSQSSRDLAITDDMKEVLVYDILGNSRKLK